MSVGLDVTAAVVTDGGLRRYAIETWRALCAREDVTVSAFALGRGHGPDVSLPVRRVRAPLRVMEQLWRRLGWPPAELFCGGVDVVHATALVPAPTRAPLVVTVHDILPITYPDLFRPGTAELHRKHLEAAKRAAVVVTTCNATADEITRVVGIPRERIVVAPLGVFEVTSTPGRSSLAPDGRYLLTVGFLTPRKRLDLLARAVARLGPQCPEVLIVGPDGWAADEVRRSVREIDRHGRMRFLGRVSDDELAALYAHASLVCQPSTAEGFGIPVLEGMRFGAAVVSAALPSIREIAGDAAALVAPGDDEALAAEIDSLLGDQERRRLLGRRARARADEFTWARTADAVVGAYRLATGAASARPVPAGDRGASETRSARPGG